MAYLNVEIKARCNDPAHIRNYLLQNNAEFRGKDQQTDTYFNSPDGRLKLRQGHIENNLIFYKRENKAGPKSSHFHLVRIEDAIGLKEVLTKAMGVKIIVEKTREIYYIANVKFHIDQVPGLGSFVEIEAGNILADLSKQELEQQCNFYLAAFSIQPGDLMETSYCDMLLRAKREKEA